MYSSILPPNSLGWPTLGWCPMRRFLGLGGGAGGRAVPASSPSPMARWMAQCLDWRRASLLHDSVYSRNFWFGRNMQVLVTIMFICHLVFVCRINKRRVQQLLYYRFIIIKQRVIKHISKYGFFVQSLQNDLPF